MADKKHLKTRQLLKCCSLDNPIFVAKLSIVKKLTRSK